MSVPKNVLFSVDGSMYVSTGDPHLDLSVGPLLVALAQSLHFSVELRDARLSRCTVRACVKGSAPSTAELAAGRLLDGGDATLREIAASLGAGTSSYLYVSVTTPSPVPAAAPPPAGASGELSQQAVGEWDTFLACDRSKESGTEVRSFFAQRPALESPLVALMRALMVELGVRPTHDAQGGCCLGAGGSAHVFRVTSAGGRQLALKVVPSVPTRMPRRWPLSLPCLRQRCAARHRLCGPWRTPCGSCGCWAAPGRAWLVGGSYCRRWGRLST